MYRVYLSSTIDDLLDERAKLSRWLNKAGHQPVESYTASTETLLESCFSEIATCDAFVLLLGDRYGEILETGLDETLSFIHLEYREARKQGLPCMVFMRTSTPNKALSDLGDPKKRAGFTALLEEIASHGPRPAEFENSTELISTFSASFHQWASKQPAMATAACGGTSKMASNQFLTVEGIAQAVHRSAIEGLNTPRDWFENWSGEVFNPPLPPSHALLQSCFIDTGLRARVIATLKAGGQTGITGFIGMGGVGKTFTALRIAWDLLSEGWQICWVSLLQRSANDVLDDIAHNFGFRFIPNLSVAEKVAALRTTLQLVSQKLGKVLIVLDNAEQFPEFAKVVGALSHLPVLVTSRTNEQAGRIRYERILPLTNERAVAFCTAFLNANRETEQEWALSAEDRADLVSLADLYKGHPLSIRMALTGFLRLPRARRTGKRPLLGLLQILKDRGLEGFATENTTVYSDDEPSERVLRSNMEATFQWLYDDLSIPTAPQVDRCAFLLLPLCAAVGAATFSLETVLRGVSVLATLLPVSGERSKSKRPSEKRETPNFVLPDQENQSAGEPALSRLWQDDVRQLASSRALVQDAIFRLERISLIDPVQGQTESFAMHPTVREFALRQEDPSGSRRPSSDMLLRAALGTLVEGINVSDALLNLLPWLKGRRSLVEQACDNLEKNWNAEEFRSFRTTRVWAEEVLTLAKDIGLTQQVIHIQCRLGELLDRMDEPSGLPMLHEALRLSNAVDKKRELPAFTELTVSACLNALTPSIYSDETVAWAAIYLASAISTCTPDHYVRTWFEALRWALDEDTSRITWNLLGPNLCESLEGGPANIVDIQPFDRNSSNAFLDITRLYERWALEGVSPELSAAASHLVDQVQLFPESPPNDIGLITPQHWIGLRIAYLGFKLLQEGLPEDQFLEDIVGLREFSLAQGIRAFRLEYKCSLLLARHRMQHERWEEAASFLKRAIAATHEIPRYDRAAIGGLREMSLLQSACISLDDNSREEVQIDLQAPADCEPDGDTPARLLPYIYIALACRSLKDRRIAECHNLAQKAVAGLQLGQVVPMYLRPLLHKLAGSLQATHTITPQGSGIRANWNHLPTRVVSTSDGRTMSLVHHGIGVLKDGKRQAWLWPFYIDDEPLTVKDVRELARRADLLVVLPMDAHDTQHVSHLHGKPLGQLQSLIGKTLPTAQERFAAAAQSIGILRWSSEHSPELDRFQLATIESVLNGMALAKAPWVDRVDELLNSSQAQPKKNGVAAKSKARSVRTVATHWAGGWIARSERWRRGFETSWLPRFQSNPLVSGSRARLLAKHVLASLSLSTAEKLRVAIAAPGLSDFQISELIKVFSDERTEFEKLWPTESEHLKGEILKSKESSQMLLEWVLQAIQEDDENVVYVSTLKDDVLEAGDRWHLQVASRSTNEDRDCCVRLVRPILIESDLEGLVPAEASLADVDHFRPL